MSLGSYYHTWAVLTLMSQLIRQYYVHVNKICNRDQSSVNVLTVSFSLSKADLTIKEKFENHRSGMVTLTKDEADLEASLPKAGASAAVISGSSVRYGRHTISLCFLVSLYRNYVN